jgi:predicted nucleic acid-binding protein
MAKLMRKDRYRCMIDVNVLVSGILWPRWQHEILRHAVQQDFRLVLASFILDSARFHVQRIIPHRITHYDQFLRDCCYELVPDPGPSQVQQNLDLVRDRSDVPIALAAINAKVDYFVTYDKDFTEEHESTQKVREAIPGIILPPVFLRDVMGWSSEALELIRHRNWDW